jgi:HTH-type transcriptional regulator/antitoxin HigA
MKMNELDTVSARRTWQAFQGTFGLAAIRTRKQHDRTIALLNQLLDVVGENERHPLAGLLDLVGDLVAGYEARAHPVPDAAPRDVLQLLMKEHGLTQAGLRDELGGQSVVSDILKGKRDINTRQAKALAARFGVSPAAFI